MTIPVLFLIITIIAFYPGGGIWLIMVVIGMTGWTGIARYTRAEFLKTRNQDYVSASIAIGNPISAISNISLRPMRIP